MPKLNKRLREKIENFLRERRPTGDGGGWPEVTERDMEQLRGVIDALIEAKFARDCDGDRVINYVLANRKHEYFNFVPVPYLHHAKTWAALHEAHARRMLNLAIAHEDVEISWRHMEIEERERAERARPRNVHRKKCVTREDRTCVMLADGTKVVLRRDLTTPCTTCGSGVPYLEVKPQAVIKVERPKK